MISFRNNRTPLALLAVLALLLGIASLPVRALACGSVRTDALAVQAAVASCPTEEMADCCCGDPALREAGAEGSAGVQSSLAWDCHCSVGVPSPPPAADLAPVAGFTLQRTPAALPATPALFRVPERSALTSSEAPDAGLRDPASTSAPSRAPPAREL